MWFLLLLLLFDPLEGRPNIVSQGITIFKGKRSRENEPVNLVIRGGVVKERLTAYFSTVGTNYEQSADIVQISSYRACDPTVRDRTMKNHIVVVFVDEVQPFLAGCVALDNQARFAEKSGALALIVGSATRLLRRVKNPSMSPAAIPVVILDDEETARLREALATVANEGEVGRADIEYIGVNEGSIGPSNAATIRLQVFRPTFVNVSLLCLMALLVLLISVVLVVKFRWRPTVHNDLWMRALAMAALKNMETRKYTKMSSSKKFLSSSTKLSTSRSRLGNLLPRFASLQSVAQASCAQERCSVCLEDFVEGALLRVLLCGHEFHSACVDPWLLSKRRCPLCQFDVVDKRWPDEEKGQKETRNTRTCGEGSEQLRPLLPLTSPVESPSHPVRPMTTPSRSRRSRSIPRRRPLRDRHLIQVTTTIGPLGNVSGYSSDVSSYQDLRVNL